MRTMLYVLLFTTIAASCHTDPFSLANSRLRKISQRPVSISHVPEPKNYKNIICRKGSFGEWISKLPLREDNILRLYDGSIKKDQRLHYAILDVPYNRNKSQQCADAVMRLYAEYLYETKALPQISFLHQRGKYFTCSSYCSRTQLEAFLLNVFNWCGTYNLYTQLKPKTFDKIEAGDVLIKAGAPGHAMLVADVAINEKGEKMFLLLQSYMPAQEIHIVINPYYPNISPWYNASDSVFTTPGWKFNRSDLRTW